MGQRLGIACALLGEPQTVILDEPINGLDPEGILWVHTLLKGLAAEGRTEFLSSHLMSEMSQTASHLIVIGRGELIADVDEAAFVAMASRNVVLVRSPQASEPRELLVGPDVSVSSPEAGLLEVHGLNSEQIGDVAFEHQLRLHGLAVQRASLEEAFMEMTRNTVEFHGEGARRPHPREVRPARPRADRRARLRERPDHCERLTHSTTCVG